eukprot:SAG22_NODE_1445_length_4406_cov_7.808684_6_plen_162_part_01
MKLSMMVREGAAGGVDAGIQSAQELGLDALDIHLAGLDRSPANLQRLGAMIVDGGLEVGYTGGGSLVGPPEEYDKRLAEGKADTDTTEVLGGKLLRVFGRAPWPDTKAEQEAMWAPMIKQCQEVADYAAPKGVAGKSAQSFSMASQWVPKEHRIPTGILSSP